ncbi:hypothetical protein HDU84_007863 [Entophlyctis sp. JEL0112]|nr:hypothetical protein HDU84_007863 [Entophlyctis sp. JEL0112]
MSCATTTTQMSALGCDPPRDIFSEDIARLYLPPHPDAVEEDSDDSSGATQTFDDFLDMGNRAPNAEGTGRIRMGERGRRGVAVLYLQGMKADLALSTFLAAYMQLKVTSVVTPLEFVHGRRTRSLVDRKRGLEFPLKVRTRRGKAVAVAVDVFSLFDVLVEYIPRSAAVAVLVCDFDICEGRASATIAGRACGDRVAVVSRSVEPDGRALSLVVAHELLHTFGLDHCNAWHCIMNAYTLDATNSNSVDSNSSALELCPADIRKWMRVLQEGGMELNLRQRWSELAALCAERGWLRDAAWFNNRLLRLPQDSDELANYKVDNHDFLA